MLLLRVERGTAIMDVGHRRYVVIVYYVLYESAYHILLRCRYSSDNAVPTTISGCGGCVVFSWNHCLCLPTKNTGKRLTLLPSNLQSTHTHS